MTNPKNEITKALLRRKLEDEWFWDNVNIKARPLLCVVTLIFDRIRNEELTQYFHWLMPLTYKLFIGINDDEIKITTNLRF